MNPHLLIVFIRPYKFFQQSIANVLEAMTFRNTGFVEEVAGDGR